MSRITEAQKATLRTLGRPEEGHVLHWEQHAPSGGLVTAARTLSSAPQVTELWRVHPDGRAERC